MKLEEVFKQINRFSNSNLEEMAKEMERVSAKESSMELKVGLAIVYDQIGREEDSRKLYEQVLKKQPNNPVVLTNLGAGYMYSEPKKAYELFKKVIDEKDSNGADKGTLSLALVNMGVLFENQRFYEIAYAKYHTALKTDPDNRLARKYIDELREKADPDYGLIGLSQATPDQAVPMLWDGSFISQFDNRYGKV